MSGPVPSGPSKTFLLFIAVCGIGVLTALGLQWNAITGLRRDIQSLRAQQETVAAPQTQASAAPDSTEMDRLRNEIADLPRLREEMRLLREQVRQGTISSQAASRNQVAPIPQTLPQVDASQSWTNRALWKALGERLAAGDQMAFSELRAAATELYRDIDYDKEKDRVGSNLRLMRAAFDVLGEQAAQGNVQALQALKSSLGEGGHLRSFAPDALGKAAAAGNTEALQILLNYPAWGILKSSAVAALQAPAQANMEAAVNMLAGVLQNTRERALWHLASQGLVGAATKGNATAQAALEAYASVTRNER